MAHRFLTSRTIRRAAMLRLAASSVASVASGYARSLSFSTRMRARISRASGTPCLEGAG